MPTTIRTLTPQGLVPVSYHAETLTDAAQHEPHNGIYTVSNTYEGGTHALLLNAHLDRMEDSARRAGIPLALDHARLRSALRDIIAQAGYGDVRFRVTVPADAPDAMIFSVEPFVPLSPDLLTRGVRVITAPDSARENPAAKTTDWMHDRHRLAQAQPPGIYDTILLDSHGHMLEGLGANFYAIIGGRLYTAAQGVLPGIAQKIVMAIAPPVLPVDHTAPHIRDLPRIEEAFITSSSRGIVPVVEIDGITLGDGTPGRFTRQLLGHYQAWVRAHLETI